MNALALPKHVFIVSLSTGEKKVVLINSVPNRNQIIAQKQVVTIDGVNLNGSFIAYTEESDLYDNTIDTAIEYAKLIKGPIRTVAMERVRRYEEKNGKMPIMKLRSWLVNFMKHGKEEGFSKDLYELYLQSGGKPEDFQ